MKITTIRPTKITINIEDLGMFSIITDEIKHNPYSNIPPDARASAAHRLSEDKGVKFLQARHRSPWLICIAVLDFERGTNDLNCDQHSAIRNCQHNE